MLGRAPNMEQAQAKAAFAAILLQEGSGYAGLPEGHWLTTA